MQNKHVLIVFHIKITTFLQRIRYRIEWEKNTPKNLAPKSLSPLVPSGPVVEEPAIKLPRLTCTINEATIEFSPP